MMERNHIIVTGRSRGVSDVVEVRVAIELEIEVNSRRK